MYSFKTCYFSSKLAGLYNILNTVYTELYDQRTRTTHFHQLFWEDSGVAHVAAAMLQLRGFILKGKLSEM